MESLLVVIVILIVSYNILKYFEVGFTNSKSHKTQSNKFCRMCKNKFSKEDVKYEITTENDGVLHILCSYCYKNLQKYSPDIFIPTDVSHKTIENQPVKASSDSIKDVLEFLDAAANSGESVRVIYHGDKGSKERMIKPIDVRDEFDPSISRRQYICLEENIVKNFLPSKMEIITDDGEVFGLGKKHKVKKYDSIYEVKNEILRLRPELEKFIDISDTHLQFKIIGKRGQFLKYPRFGLDYAEHREHRPWASHIPLTTSYFKHLDKAADFLIKNIKEFNIERDFHS